MDILIKKADISNFYIIKNFIPLFRHYIAEVYDELPNIHGVFSYDDCRSLQELCDKREKWLDKPNELFPYIIYYGKIPVGYILISKVLQNSYINSDYFIEALFIVQSARRKHIATTVLKQVTILHQGRWQVNTNCSDKNIPTQMFWRKFVSEFSNGKFEEFIGDTDDGHKLIFRFCNSDN